MTARSSASNDGGEGLDSHVDGYLQHGIEVREGETVMDVGANIGLFASNCSAVSGKSSLRSSQPRPSMRC